MREEVINYEVSNCAQGWYSYILYLFKITPGAGKVDISAQSHSPGQKSKSVSQAVSLSLHTQTHAHTYTHTHVRTHAHTYTHTHACTQTHAHTHRTARRGVTQQTDENPKATTLRILALGRCEPGLAAPAPPPPLPSPTANRSGRRVHKATGGARLGAHQVQGHQGKQVRKLETGYGQPPGPQGSAPPAAHTPWGGEGESLEGLWSPSSQPATHTYALHSQVGR